jgi:hypothetical protein
MPIRLAKALVKSGNIVGRSKIVIAASRVLVAKSRANKAIRKARSQRGTEMPAKGRRS